MKSARLPESLMRFGTIALVGRTNVGKSTLMNAALGEALAITSPLPQTTRDTVLGIAHKEGVQMAILDTPGIHQPKSELGRRMNDSAKDTLRQAEVVLMVTDVFSKPPRTLAGLVASGDPAQAKNVWLRAGDESLIKLLREEVKVPVVLAINKVDQHRDKSMLLPMLAAYGETGLFAEIVPVSARTGSGVPELVDCLTARLPEGNAGYEGDALTNRPTLFFVREYVREAILNQLSREVPHAVAVSIDRADESDRMLRVAATIHVEKLGQRKIIVGKGGARIKAIGTAARLRIEELAQKKVFLELFVRVTEEWKNTPRMLAELGYDGGTSSPGFGTGLVAPGVSDQGALPEDSASTLQAAEGNSDDADADDVASDEARA